MYKYPVRRISIAKLISICPYIEGDLESRTESEDYEKIYNKLINSKSGYIYLTYDDCDLISYIYEDDDGVEHKDLTKLLYGRNAIAESVQLEEDYKSDVDNYYNDLKSVLIDEGPEASLILSLVYDDLYKNNIRLDIVQRYADVDYSVYQMLLARKALLSGLDDIEVDFIFSTNLSQDQQSEVINALRTDVPYLTIKSWIKQNYTPAQMELATRCYVLKINSIDTSRLIDLNLDDEMTQYVKQALLYKIPVSKIINYVENQPLIDFKRAIRNAKQLYTVKNN